MVCPTIYFSVLVFGPVPSRRLGRSLGINNIPAKVCSYSCVYCQLGPTTSTIVERRAFYDPADVYKEAKRRLAQVRGRGEEVDYLTFVPDGEPTLDVNLGVEIKMLKKLGVPIAVLSNASLLYRKDVREDLAEADLVSLKVDAVSKEIWSRVNRPHGELDLNLLLEGCLDFAEEYGGKLITETMLIDGINYGEELDGIARYLSRLKPLKAYLAVPTRPPSEAWAKPAREEILLRAFRLLTEELGTDRVELLTGYEGNAFFPTGDPVNDLLSVTSVHPMREDAVRELLRRDNAGWEVVERLIREGKLVELKYEGHKFYIKRLR